MATRARPLHKLTNRACEAARPGTKIGDGGGLWLHVSPTGAKGWRFLYRFGNRRREAGLGAFPAVSLADARERAEECRKALAIGRDPLDVKREREAVAKLEKAREITFGSYVLDMFLPTATAGLRNAKHAAQWKSTLETYGAPLWPKTLASIRPVDVLGCVSPIWLSKPETAQRVRQRVEKVFSSAISSGLYDGLNPARLADNLENLLPRRSGPRAIRHHASMDFRAVPGFIADLRQRTAVAALALELVVLTACRSGEIRLATWAEYDADARLLRLPASRTKGGRAVEIPLTARAVDIIERARELSRSTEADDYIFQGERRGKPLSVMAFDMLLRRMGVEATTHGFRSSFRNWAHEKTNYRREIIEQCLSHIVGNKTEQAYLRSTALEERRKIMAAWAQYCEPMAANVVSLPGRTA